MSNSTLSTITKTAIKTLHRVGLKAKKNSPELLLIGGTITFAGTIYLACKATLKLDDILENHKETISWIEKGESEGYFDYTPEDAKKDRQIMTAKTAVKIARVYAPAAAMGTVSIGCFVVSHTILKNRYLGMVSAFNSVSAAYTLYRNRVREELGDQMDRHFRYGTKIDKIDVVEMDENGKNKKKKVEVEETDKETAGAPSIYSRWFDETNVNWDKNVTFSLMFLRAKQNIANDMLHSRGHLFLNEVYDMLGYPHTQEGAVVGWVEGYGDDFVDFGIYDPRNESSRKFVNGADNVILLDFNHDGVIFDKI